MEAECYDTVQQKAVDSLLNGHGYTDASLTPQADGSLAVEAERRAGTHNTRWRLNATVGANGEVTDVRERDW